MDHADTYVTPRQQAMPVTGQECNFNYEDQECAEEEYLELAEIITDPVMEEYELTILYLLHDVAWLVRGLYAGRYAFPLKGHPVDISFCFKDGSLLRERAWEGYKVNPDIIEEWENITQLASFFGI
ncbi:MAG: hypothetical protein IJ137_08560 [Eubacterium sp.]|nr:hypothetical protein [Eubacterium sp.]